MSAWSVARYHSQGANQALAESEQLEKSTVLLRTFAQIELAFVPTSSDWAFLVGVADESVSERNPTLAILRQKAI